MKDMFGRSPRKQPKFSRVAVTRSYGCKVVPPIYKLVYNPVQIYVP